MGSNLCSRSYRSNGVASRRLLRCVPLFASLGDDQIAEILKSVEYRHYSRHSFLVAAGEDADGLHVIVTGSAKVLVSDGEGREVILGVLGPNDFFGEVALIDGLPQSTSVQALESCQTLYVPRYAFLACFRHSLEAAVIMLRAVVTRVRNADRQIESFALLDVHGRVARLLSESAHEVDGRWVVDLGSQRISLMVAASREMISRVLKRLEDEHLIARSKRKIIVIDKPGLARLGRIGGTVRAAKEMSELSRSGVTPHMMVRSALRGEARVRAQASNEPFSS